MIHAGVSELRRAFHGHRSAVGGTSPSDNLLLFYAAECGLKSAWMNRNKLRTTAQIDPTLLGQEGHNLMLWAKKLSLPAAVTGAGGRFRLARDGQACDAMLAHQAWRYGIWIVAQDEKNLCSWIRNLCDWIKREIHL
jgi:hypothetical protein